MEIRRHLPARACSGGPGWEGAVEFVEVVSQGRDRGAAGDLPLPGALVERLEELLVLLLVLLIGLLRLLAAGVEQERLQVPEPAATETASPAGSTRAWSRTCIPSSAR